MDCLYPMFGNNHKTGHQIIETSFLLGLTQKEKNYFTDYCNILAPATVISSFSGYVIFCNSYMEAVNNYTITVTALSAANAASCVALFT